MDVSTNMTSLNSLRNDVERMVLELRGNLNFNSTNFSFPYKQSIKFKNGFVLNTEKLGREFVRKLLVLSNDHSVEFNDVRTNSQQWILNTNDFSLILPNNLKFVFDSIDPLIFTETFLYDIHFVGFDLNEKVVIDAGGFVGDTALYYANLGAEVFTFEPDPVHFNLLKRNLQLNPQVSSKIHPINSALGPDGIFKFGKDSEHIGKISENGFGDYEVESLSLEKVLDKFKIDSPYLLHLDIKGSEGSILESPAIRKFSKLRVEYSPYLTNSYDTNIDYPEWIHNTVRAHGFQKTRLFKHNHLNIPMSVHGTLDASKE